MQGQGWAPWQSIDGTAAAAAGDAGTSRSPAKQTCLRRLGDHARRALQLRRHVVKAQGGEGLLQQADVLAAVDHAVSAERRALGRRRRRSRRRRGAEASSGRLARAVLGAGHAGGLQPGALGERAGVLWRVLLGRLLLFLLLLPESAGRQHDVARVMGDVGVQARRAGEGSGERTSFGSLETGSFGRLGVSDRDQ